MRQIEHSREVLSTLAQESDAEIILPIRMVGIRKAVRQTGKHQRYILRIGKKKTGAVK